MSDFTIWEKRAHMCVYIPYHLGVQAGFNAGKYTTSGFAFFLINRHLQLYSGAAKYDTRVRELGEPRCLRLAEDVFSKRHAGARVVGLDGNRLDPALLDHDGIALGPLPAEDGRAVKGHVEHLGELARGVREEADLQSVSLRNL